MIDIYMGKPGSGKSTILTLEARKAMRKGTKVYSNFYIKGAYKLELDKLGIYQYEDALLIIDEAGISMGNGDWKEKEKTKTQNGKSLRKNMYAFMTLHRHYNLRIILGIQMWSRLDPIIRELIANIYVCKPTIIPRFVRRSKINVAIDIDENTHQIIESFNWKFLGTRYKYAPPAWKLFNTTEKEDLQPFEDTIWDIPTVSY